MRIRETMPQRIEAALAKPIDEATALRYAASGMLTVKEACAHAKLSESQLYGHMDGGRLPYVRDGRARRIPRAALDDFLALRLVRRDDLYLIDVTPRRRKP
jgi:excisionase family DNA binding protein